MMQLVARAVIPLEGKLLLVQNKGADYWCLPGGNVEPGEPIVQALEREIAEELGVRPVVGQLLYVQQFFREPDEQQVEFFFLVENPEDYSVVDVARTTHGVAELDAVAFRGLADTDVRPAFLAEELPDLLGSSRSGALPQFRVSDK